MNKFISLQEHYCPYLKKNIVIEKEINEDNENRQGSRETNICLNYHECNCGEGCQNNLLDLDIEIRKNNRTD